MATVTGYTAERMKNIEDKTITDGEVQGDDLVLFARDGTNIQAGNVRGPQGPQGPIGEVSAAQLDAATDPSVNPGNDITNGSDGKLFFDHDTKYTEHVHNFVDNPARDTALPTPTQGQLCRVAGALQTWDGRFAKWVPLVHGGLEFYGQRNASQPVVSDNTLAKVAWDDIVTNVGNAWDAPSNSWIAPKAGLVEVCSTITFAMSGGMASQLFAAIYLDNTDYRIAQCQVQGGVQSYCGGGTRQLQVVQGNKISLQYSITAAGITKSIFGARMTFMSIRYIG